MKVTAYYLMTTNSKVGPSRSSCMTMRVQPFLVDLSPQKSFWLRLVFASIINAKVLMITSV